MRREQGILILETKEMITEISSYGFEGIIVDIGYIKDMISIFMGRYANNTNCYEIKYLDIIPANRVLSFENLIKLVKEILETNHSEKIEMGFPEIAITEDVRKSLSN